MHLNKEINFLRAFLSFGKFLSERIYESQLPSLLMYLHCVSQWTLFKFLFIFNFTCAAFKTIHSAIQYLAIRFFKICTFLKLFTIFPNNFFTTHLISIFMPGSENPIIFSDIAPQAAKDCTRQRN